MLDSERAVGEIKLPCLFLVIKATSHQSRLPVEFAHHCSHNHLMNRFSVSQPCLFICHPMAIHMAVPGVAANVIVAGQDDSFLVFVGKHNIQHFLRCFVQQMVL